MKSLVYFLVNQGDFDGGWVFIYYDVVTTTHTPAFYDHLVRWEVIDFLISHFDEAERPTAHQQIVASLDYTVHSVTLHHLPSNSHQTYLQLSMDRHHDTALLDWLEERQPGITDHLTEAIHRTKQSLAEELEIDITSWYT